MNRHFTDARYHLRRTVTELRRGLAMALADLRTRLPTSEQDEDEDVVDVVRARGEQAREKAREVGDEAAQRFRAIR